MTRPRVSIGWLMLAVALIGFHLAVLCADRPVFGLDGFEVGLLPGVTALTIRLFLISRHGGKVQPFAWGFVASLTLAIGVYLICCLTIPNFVRLPII